MKQNRGFAAIWGLIIVAIVLVGAGALWIKNECTSVQNVDDVYGSNCPGFAAKWFSEETPVTTPPPSGTLPPPNPAANPAPNTSERANLYDTFGKITNWSVTDPDPNPGSSLWRGHNETDCPAPNPAYKVVTFNKVWNAVPDASLDGVTDARNKISTLLENQGWVKCGEINAGDAYPVTEFVKGNRILEWRQGFRAPVLGGYFDTLHIEYANSPASGVASVNVPVFTDGGDVVCGQKIVYIKRTVPLTQAPLNATFRELFAMPNPYVENGTQYSNPIGYQTTKKEYPPLKFIRVDLVNGVASVYLEGSITGVGTCYDPLPAMQLGLAAKQFPTVSSVKFYLNGRETDPGCIADQMGTKPCYNGVN